MPGSPGRSWGGTGPGGGVKVSRWTLVPRCSSLWLLLPQIEAAEVFAYIAKERLMPPADLQACLLSTVVRNINREKSEEVRPRSASLAPSPPRNSAAGQEGPTERRPSHRHERMRLSCVCMHTPGDRGVDARAV